MVEFSNPIPLPPRQALAAEMYQAGKSAAQVAVVMGITAKSVRVLLSKAGVTLRPRSEPKEPSTPRPPSFWTDEREAQLRRLITVEGLSSNGAAKRLGCTKNQVIAKARRVGIKLVGLQRASDDRKIEVRAAERRAPKPPKPPRPKAEPKAYAPPPPPLVVAELPAPDNVVQLVDLKWSQCRWPFGDPSSAGFGFCGAPKKPHDKAYCAGHRRLASSPVKKPMRVQSDSTPRRYARAN